jgi:hypothetical protein
MQAYIRLLLIRRNGRLSTFRVGHRPAAVLAVRSGMHERTTTIPASVPGRRANSPHRISQQYSVAVLLVASLNVSGANVPYSSRAG